MRSKWKSYWSMVLVLVMLITNLVSSIPAAEVMAASQGVENGIVSEEGNREQDNLDADVPADTQVTDESDLSSSEDKNSGNTENNVSEEQQILAEPKEDIAVAEQQDDLSALGEAEEADDNAVISFEVYDAATQKVQLLLDAPVLVPIKNGDSALNLAEKVLGQENCNVDSGWIKGFTIDGKTYNGTEFSTDGSWLVYKNNAEIGDGINESYPQDGDVYRIIISTYDAANNYALPVMPTDMDALYTNIARAADKTSQAYADAIAIVQSASAQEDINTANTCLSEAGVEHQIIVDNRSVFIDKGTNPYTYTPTVQIVPKKANAGETVTVTINPVTGMKLVENSVKANGVVLTESQTPGTYTFTMPDEHVVVMAEFAELKSDGNKLSELAFSLDEAGEQSLALTPEFSPDVTEYQMSVDEVNLPANSSVLYLKTVYPEGANAKFHFMMDYAGYIMEAGSAKLTSGTPYANKKVNLFYYGNQMRNYVEMIPAAETGLLAKNYYITMSMIPNLEKLTVTDEKSGADLDISFDPQTKEYNLCVSKDVAEISVAAEAINDENTVSINGTEVSGSTKVTLENGKAQLEIQVEDDYGVKGIYTLNVEQAEQVTLRVAPKACSLKVYNSEDKEMTLGEGAQVSNYMTYTSLLPAGTYRYEGFDAENNSIGGAFFTVKGDVEDQSFYFRQVNFKASNSGFVAGTDYTAVVWQDSKEQQAVSGKITSAGQYPVLVLCGSTCYYELQPSEAKEAEAYTTYTGSVTITKATTAQSISQEIPLLCQQKITVPTGATLFVGTKTANYVPFTEVLPNAEESDNDDGTTTYQYELKSKHIYNYRVMKEGCVTLGNKFNAAAEAEDIVITAADLEGDSSQIDRDPESNNGYNVGDIYLGINEQNFLTMNEDEQFQIVSLRSWEAVDSITNNYFIEPDYHYIVIDENGNVSSDVITIDEKGIITAVGKGTAIVLVTYDAINVYGSVYGAIWPENTGVFVVSVGQDTSGVDLGMTMYPGENTTSAKVAGDAVDTEHDVFYYLEGTKGAYYTFTPSEESTVSILRPVVSDTAMTFAGGYTQDGVTEEDGNVTVRLTEGRNIIKVTKDGKSNYQVLTAKEASVSIINATEGSEPDDEIVAGDKVKIVFDTVYHPANKLAGVYNMSARIWYGTDYSGKSGNQYTFASTANAQTIELTIPEDYEDSNFYLENGYIRVTGYGDPYGGHRTIDYVIGKNPNFTALSRNAKLSVLPDIEIPVVTVQQREDHKATAPAKEAIEQLPAINDITLEDEEMIKAAREEYEKLNEDQKAFVAEYYDILVAAEKRLEEMEEAAKAVKPSKPVGVTLSVASASTVKISWSKAADVSGYEVWYATAKDGAYKKVKTTTGTSYTQTKLKAGTTYFYKIRSYKTVSGTNVYSDYTAPKSKKLTVPTPTKIKLVNSSANSLKISWSKVSDASGYEIYRAASKGGSYKKVKTLSTTAFTNKSLANGKTYYYKVRAYKTVAGNKKYSSFCDIKSKKVTLAKTTLTAAAKGKTSIKLSWKKVSGAAKYEVYRAASKNGTYKKIKTTSSLTFTNTSLKNNKTYYYKVKAVQVISKKTYRSTYSTVQSAKTKK